MANTADTKARLRRWAANVASEAFDAELDLLTQGVPRGTNPTTQPRLAETRQTARTEFGGSITYPTQVANFTNEGTGPHIIRARAGRVLRFVWPAGPPELASPRGSATFFFPQVNHPGAHKHDGWWDKRVNQTVWANLIRSAASRVTF